MNEMNNRAKVHQKIFLFLSIGLVFFMPIERGVLPPIILLMTLNWLIEGRFIKNFTLIFKEKHRLMTFSLSALYLFYIAGMLWTENYNYGWFDLEVKFSLFLFPLIFATANRSAVNEGYRRSVLWAFVWGCLTGMLILIVNALYRYSLFQDLDVFYYSGFSDSFHASYLAMYLCFSLAVLVWFLMDTASKTNTVKRAGMVFVSVFFMAMIFLLSSKAGLLSLLIVISMVVVYLGFIRKKWRHSLIFLVIGITLFYGFSRLLPASIGRFSNVRNALEAQKSNPKGATTESNAERLMVWKSSLKIIIENPYAGTGTGDVKDALLDRYDKDGATAPMHQKLNAHNQYLQTFATLGIIGFMLLLSLLFLPAFYALRYKDYLFFTFLLIMAFNLLVESMFEQQAGVIFFAFFNSFFSAQLSSEKQVDS